MAAAAEPSAPWRTLRELLAAELARKEGRAAATARIAVACSLTVMLAMIFRIPMPAYMAYVVFVISKEHRAATLTAAVGGFIGANLAILMTVALFAADLSEPALRLPLMALATFIAMHTSRTCTLGPVTFLTGFIVVNLQTVVDDIPSPEALLRLALWLWVVVLVPFVLILASEALAGQGRRTLIRRTTVHVLDQLASALERGTLPAELADWRDEVVALVPLAPTGREAGQDSEAGLISARALGCLVDALLLMPLWSQAVPVHARECLGERVRALRDALATERLPVRAASSQHDTHDGASVPPVVAALEQALDRLDIALRSAGAPQPGSQAEAPGPTAPREPHRLFVKDAFTNPAHYQFALKTTLAVMAVYITYTLLDWPGLRTSVVTCFFVSLGSLGETVHKLMLRISGAVIGGVMAGLCIVLVLPALTDIGQLSLLVGLVAAGCGWIATSSERLSYAGLQTAFAFFLGTLQSYGPATDLTVLRDRLVGILLGNIVMTIVFSSLWPESAMARARAALAGALRGVAGMLTATKSAAHEPRLETLRQIAAARKYLVLADLELRMIPAAPRAMATAAQLAAVTELAAVAVLTEHEQLNSPGACAGLRERARWLVAAAACVEDMQPLPLPAAVTDRLTDRCVGAPGSAAAQNLLSQGIEHVASQLA